MHGEPKWSRQELAVVDRCIRKIAQGRYPSQAEAIRECRQQLDALRRSQSGPGRSSFRRTATAVELAISTRKRQAGLPPAYRHWTAAENLIIERFIEDMRRKRYDSLLAAARECHRELKRLRASPDCPVPRPIARDVRTVYFRLIEATRDRNLTWPFHRWSDAEQRVARRFARACLAGRYASLRAAARVCQRKLARKSNRPRQFAGVYSHVYEEARRLGAPRLQPEWTPAQTRILTRYVGLLIDRRYRYAYEAARDCHKALDGAHSYGAVFDALKQKTTAAGIPRYHTHLTREDLRVAERYALMVHEGKLPHWTAAAMACRSELRRRLARTKRIGNLRLSHADTHPFGTIHAAILSIAHSRNLRGPRNPRWSEAEDRLAQSWVRWFDRYRLVLRLAPLKQAAEGLSEDLDKAGYQRKLNACRARVVLLWRRQQGLVRQRASRTRSISQSAARRISGHIRGIVD